MICRQGIISLGRPDLHTHNYPPEFSLKDERGLYHGHSTRYPVNILAHLTYMVVIHHIKIAFRALFLINILSHACPNLYSNLVVVTGAWYSGPKRTYGWWPRIDLLELYAPSSKSFRAMRGASLSSA